MNDLKILIIGGTQMVGRDFVELCLEKNIYPVLANRGLTNKNLFSNLTNLKIDRNNKDECLVLKDLIFDLIIDFSCYNPKQLTNILQQNLLYKKYIVLSTLCVYDNNALNNKEHWLHNYCLGKKYLEDYIKEKNLSNFLIVRPCVLYGKYDYTNRFYESDNKIYWKHNNSIVEESKYYIPIRKFSNLLYNYIFNYRNNEIKSIDINSTEIIEYQ